MPSRAIRTPSSKPPSAAPWRYSAISALTSRSVAVRRNACEASAVTIVCAHCVCCAGCGGWQAKILRRLGVSDTPVGSNGPVIAMSRRCGRVVKP